MENFEKLKRKRSVFRTAATKLITKAELLISDLNISANEKCDQLNIIKEQLNEKLISLKELNTHIEIGLSDTEFEADIELSEQYSENIIEWKFKISKFLNDNRNLKVCPTTLESTNVSVSENSASNNVSSNFLKLPKLTVEKFYGCPSSWLEFWGQFCNAIHLNESLSSIDKFCYLKSLLGGVAAKAIAGFSLTSENYNSAIDLLQERFGRTDMIINAHMNKLLNLRPVSNSSDLKALRELYDTCEIQIRNLDSLGVVAGSYGNLLCPILFKLIPSGIALEFNRKRVKKSDWDIKELMKFLKEEIESREATVPLNSEKNVINKDEKFKYPNFKRNVPSTSALTTTIKNPCLFCDSAIHGSENCKSLSILEKREKLKKEGRCFVCFRKFHIGAKCKFLIENCKKCNSKLHNSTVCLKLIENKSDNPKTENETLTSVCQNKSENAQSRNEIILQTSVVKISSNLKTQIAFCLHDSASHRCYITKQLTSQLKPDVVRKEKLMICSFGGKNAKEQIYDVVKVKLEHLNEPSRFICIEALVVETISNVIISPPKLSRNLQCELSKYKLVNWRDQATGSRIDVLIGSDYLWEINYPGRVEKISRSLFVCESIFGWSLCGAIQNGDKKNNLTSVFNALLKESENENLRKLWELEALGIQENVESELDREIMTKFENNLKFCNNRYETNLLWKDKQEKLGNNFRIANIRFDNLSRKLAKNDDVLNKYKEIVFEQKLNNVVERCPDGDTDNGYFMPHRPVIRDDKQTTKVRMVFDASSKEKHLKSLNECLWQGPNLNPNILDIIFNFRKYDVAFCGDLEKAFLQISIYEEDRNYLKFLWFSDVKNNAFEILRFTRVPFGVTCSPFILAATIKKHIQKYQDNHPDVVKMLDTCIYVDDLISGSNSESEAFYLSSTASKIFDEAGMHLRKLTSNSKKLLDMWKNSKLCDDIDNSNSPLKVLGCVWDTISDCLKLDVQPLVDSWENIIPTKRFILKTMLKLFDPVGFIAPFTIRMKILLQETWKRGLTWDSELPLDLRKEWDKWYSETQNIKDLAIPRKYFSHELHLISPDVQIHIFCDASPHAFGAVAYIRYTTKDQEYKTSFLWSKSRVSPLKKITIPRLELLGAVIAVRMSKHLKNSLNFRNLDITFWSDSKITLCWIKGNASNYKPFVSNRVREIQSLSDPEHWKYCCGSDNPADLLTRGEKVTYLIHNELWWQGPPWLSSSELNWPSREPEKLSEEALVEYKSKLEVIPLCCTLSLISEDIFNIENFSKLSRVYRVTAWVMRFLHNLNPKNSKISGSLTASELKKAEIYWIRRTQECHFKQELDHLKCGKPIHKYSSLYNLNPELDENNLLILKGRMQFSHVSEREKHPWVLPAKSKFVELLILNAHERMYHFGIATTLAHLRERYYIIKGRRCVKSVLRSCIICRKFSAMPGKEVNPPLPKDRVVESPPFETTGIDFAGPVYVKTSSGSEKAYIVLLTCAVTRAIHLELVTSLSTSSFILAFRRFVARRGLCKTIYSDNAKTFLKANSLLREIWKSISKPDVFEYFSKNNIVWKFIVPRAAWWGGFWERMVRTVKTPLKKVLGKTCLNFEEMQTTLTEVEAVINSRPLTYIYEDHGEPEPLSPAHFLVGKRLTSLPQGSSVIVRNESTKKVLTKSLRYREQAMNHFWRRWRREYLLELRNFNQVSSTESTNSLKVGDVVLIFDEKLPRHLWKYGKVEELFYGRDSRARSCLLRTSKGLIKRPIQLLYKFELDITDNSSKEQS